jgi:hypothetical protein
VSQKVAHPALNALLKGFRDYVKSPKKPDAAGVDWYHKFPVTLGPVLQPLKSLGAFLLFPIKAEKSKPIDLRWV